MEFTGQWIADAVRHHRSSRNPRLMVAYSADSRGDDFIMLLVDPGDGSLEISVREGGDYRDRVFDAGRQAEALAFHGAEATRLGIRPVSPEAGAEGIARVMAEPFILLNNGPGGLSRVTFPGGSTASLLLSANVMTGAARVTWRYPGAEGEETFRAARAGEACLLFHAHHAALEAILRSPPGGDVPAPGPRR